MTEFAEKSVLFLKENDGYVSLPESLRDRIESLVGDMDVELDAEIEGDVSL